MENSVMSKKNLLLLIGLCLFIIGCAVVGNTPNLAEAPTQPEIMTSTQNASDESFPDKPVTTGIHFSGQGPTTWAIQKDPGMVLLHLKVENCGSLVISGKGQNIPYMETNLPGRPGQFDDQYQYFNDFKGSPDREETIILDPPAPYEDYDAPPHTEMLRIEEVSDDCKWELTILPMSSARTIAPGNVVIGEYNDVLAVDNGLSGLKLLFMSPGHDRMLQNFRGLYAVTQDKFIWLEAVPNTQIYEDIPSDALYLVIYSEGYWELQGD